MRYLDVRRPEAIVGAPVWSRVQTRSEISVMAQRPKRLLRTRLCEIVNVNGGLGLIIICILKTFSSVKNRTDAVRFLTSLMSSVI